MTAYQIFGLIYMIVYVVVIFAVTNWIVNQEKKVTRFNTPMTEFANYVKTEPGASDPRITPAALITQEALAHVREYWQLPSAQVGMWVLMESSGKGFVMTDSNFKAKYAKLETTASCDHMKNVPGGKPSECS